MLIVRFLLDLEIRTLRERTGLRLPPTSVESEGSLKIEDFWLKVIPFSNKKEGVEISTPSFLFECHF
jgi:hypothetical protein